MLRNRTSRVGLSLASARRAAREPGFFNIA
jgi:hypothetical protein